MSAGCWLSTETSLPSRPWICCANGKPPAQTVQGGRPVRHLFPVWTKSPSVSAGDATNSTPFTAAYPITLQERQLKLQPRCTFQDTHIVLQPPSSMLDFNPQRREVIEKGASSPQQNALLIPSVPFVSRAQELTVSLSC